MCQKWKTGNTITHGVTKGIITVRPNQQLSIDLYTDLY